MKKIFLLAVSLWCAAVFADGPDNLLKEPLKITNPKTTVFKDGVYTIVSPDAKTSSQIIQLNIPVNQTEPGAVTFAVEGRALENEGNAGCNFGAIINLHFTDGTRQNGVNFGMGGNTFDWVSRSRIYIPKKPVKSIDFIVQYHRIKGKVEFRNPKLYNGTPAAVASARAAASGNPYGVPANKIGKMKIVAGDRHLDTFLVQAGKPAAAIVGDAKLAAKVNAAIKAKTGIALPVLPHTAYELADKLDRNLIVLGSRDNNRTMSNLYSFHFALIDAKYPGKGGYDVHSLHNPFGDKHNVILAGGSDPQGDLDAVNALVKHIAKAPKSKTLKLGFISDAKLSPAYKVARDVKDIPLWESSFGYGNKGYFGWNSLARNLAMLYITNDPYYKNEFLRLAFPKDKATQKELFDRDDEAYHDRSAPIVQVYHYRGQYMSLYWDMVDENPIFTDAERQLVAKTLYDQLVFRLTRADYTNPYRNYDKPALVRPDRHYCWEVLQAYTTARYLHKDNPCFETSEGLRMGRNAMEPLLKKQVIGNIALFWVPTSMELQFYYAAVNGNRFIDNPLLREYANCLTLLSTLDYGSDARIEVYGSPWLYLCGAFFAQDQAMVRLALNKTRPGSFAAKTVHDYSVFRVGQSYWPTKSYPHDSVKEHLGKWNTFATYIPQTPDKQEVLFTSYRTKPDNTGDFMLVDPHYSTGLRDPQHNFAMLFAVLNGGPVLYGYENAFVPYADGLAKGAYPFDAKIVSQGAQDGFSWITGRIEKFNGFDCERTWILREGKYLVAVDRVVALGPMKSARFDAKYTAGFKGKAEALPDGDFEASTEYCGKQYTFNWSFADDVPASRAPYNWSSYLQGDSVTFQPAMDNLEKGVKASFVTLFRPGKALDTRSTARDGDVIALRTPEPALLTLTDNGFTLVGKDKTFTMADNQVTVSGGDASISGRAMTLLAGRKKAPFKPAALPRAVKQPRWETRVPGAAGLAVIADKEIAVSGGDTVTVLDWASGREIGKVKLDGAVFALAYHPQAKLWLAGTVQETLAAFDSKGAVRWKFTSRMHPDTLKMGPYWHKSAVKGVRSLLVRDGLIYMGSASTLEVLKPDGTLVAREFVRYAGVDRMLLNPVNNHIILIRPHGGAGLHEVTMKNKVAAIDHWAMGRRDNLNSFGFNQVGQFQIGFFKEDGKWFAADMLTGAQNRFIVRNPAGAALYEADFGSGRLGSQLGVPNLGVRTLRGFAFADLEGDGKTTIALGHANGSIYVFDGKLNVKALYNVFSIPLSFASDGKAFFVGLNDGRIVTIDKDGIRVIGRQPSPITVLEVLPSGRLLAGCADGTVAGY